MAKRLAALAAVAAALVLTAGPAAAEDVCIPFGTFEVICLIAK